VDGIIEVEKVLESTFGIIYPVTLVKFILNKKKILTILRKITQGNFKSSYPPFSLDNSQCTYCKQKVEMGVKCRMHTSIDRIFSTMQVVKDPETEIYMYKNEIFKEVAPDTIGLIYCPHTKMVPETGPLNSSRVKKITPFVFQQKELKLPDYSVIELNVKELESMKLKYWFSPEYYLITDPESETGFTLVPIK
jgi:hypothetical protein